MFFPKLVNNSHYIYYINTLYIYIYYIKKQMKVMFLNGSKLSFIIEQFIIFILA